MTRTSSLLFLRFRVDFIGRVIFVFRTFVPSFSTKVKRHTVSRTDATRNVVARNIGVSLKVGELARRWNSIRAI